jgi:hypothetical protein
MTRAVRQSRTAPDIRVPPRSALRGRLDARCVEQRRSTIRTCLVTVQLRRALEIHAAAIGLVNGALAQRSGVSRRPRLSSARVRRRFGPLDRKERPCRCVSVGARSASAAVNAVRIAVVCVPSAKPGSTSTEPTRPGASPGRAAAAALALSDSADGSSHPIVSRCVLNCCVEAVPTVHPATRRLPQLAHCDTLARDAVTAPAGRFGGCGCGSVIRSCLGGQGVSPRHASSVEELAQRGLAAADERIAVCEEQVVEVEIEEPAKRLAQAGPD